MLVRVGGLNVEMVWVKRLLLTSLTCLFVIKVFDALGSSFRIIYEGSLIIHIDDKDLSNILLRRSADLGDFKAWDVIGLVLGGFVDSVSIFFSDVSGCIKGAVGVIGLVLILRGLFLLYKSVFHPYSVDDLNRKILQAKRIEINSSLIALVDGNYEFGIRFLLYHDDGWDCDFLPNHRGDAIGAGEYERQALSASLYRGFSITINPADISFVTECDSNKRSTDMMANFAFITIVYTRLSSIIYLQIGESLVSFLTIIDVVGG